MVGGACGEARILPLLTFCIKIGKNTMADYPFRLVLRKHDLEAEINYQTKICNKLKQKLRSN